MNVEEYNALANALNAKLMAVEGRLAAHPFPARADRFPYSFRRRGNKWSLCVAANPDSDPRHWSECSIDERCSLALALGDLCEDIDRQRAHMFAAVSSAHAALDELETMTGVKLG